MNSRPLKHLQQFNKRYPNAWQLIDKFRQNYGNAMLDCPRWCFLPTDVFHAIGFHQIGINTSPIDPVDDFSALIALSKWRITQGIYRFDASLEGALVDSPITGNLPVDVFYRLPEWCVYIETNNMEYIGEKIYGFFVNLGYNGQKKHGELRILLDGECRQTPVILHLGNWSVKEAINKLFTEGVKYGMQLDAQEIETFSELIASSITPFLSLILYLCSEKPEYSGGFPSGRPQPQKTKKGLRFFPPDKAKIIEVGKVIGEKLRSSTSSNHMGDFSDRSVRPHFRRGHWHHYWRGKKSGGRQTQYLVVKWLEPMGINTNYLMDFNSCDQEAA